MAALQDIFAFAFHGLNAVAELKLPVGTVAEHLGHVAFHGLNAVAELKQHHAGRSGENAHAFHGLNAVAELKVQHRLAELPQFGGLPRPQRRGRIEASIFAASRFANSTAFHGLNAVAELKLYG